MKRDFVASLKPLLAWPWGLTQQSWKQILRSAIGAALAIAVTGGLGLWLTGDSSLPWLLAPMGATAVLLFAVPASPLAQPWPVFASSMLAAAVAITCARWLPSPILAAAMAVGVTIALMFALRCLHPPAGALALLMALADEHWLAHGYGLLVYPVLVDVCVMLLMAVFYHRLTGYRYPHQAPTKPEPKPATLPSVLEADLDQALSQYGELLDVSRDDLLAVYRLVAVNALHRQLGEMTCGEVMTRNPVAVRPGDHLEQVWRHFQTHSFKAIPVVDEGRRVIGIVTREDILSRAGGEDPFKAGKRIRRFVRRVRVNRRQKPEQAGQVMSAPVVTLQDALSLIDAVTIFAGHGHSHYPVVDEQDRLVGIIARSDAMRAIYDSLVRSSGSQLDP